MIEISIKENIKGEVKRTLRSREFDRSFPKEIMKHPSGEKLYLCYQCGSCVGSCPVGKVLDSFNPRQIIRMTLLGLKDKVLSNDAIWLCASCYTCQERCPMGIEIADLLLAIRNVAASEGYAPKALVDQALSIIESGRIAKITSLMNKRRAKLGLPQIHPASLGDIKKIMEMTAFDKLIGKLEETA